MRLTKQLILGLFIILLSQTTWDAWIDGITVKAQQSSNSVSARPYTEVVPKQPFTFVSSYTVITGKSNHAIRHDKVIAVDSRGRHVAINDFESTDATAPFAESIFATRKYSALYLSKWAPGFGKPLVAMPLQSKGLVTEEFMPKDACVSADPAMKFVRKDTLSISRANYAAAIVQTTLPEVPGMFSLSWRALHPGLGCLELKSIFIYDSPFGDGSGSIIHEPKSLEVGEPDPQLFDPDSPVRSRQPDTSSGDQDAWERIPDALAKTHPPVLTFSYGDHMASLRSSVRQAPSARPSGPSGDTPESSHATALRSEYLDA
jgi:hypothetical protein